MTQNERLDETQLASWRNFITAHARLIDKIDRELIEADRLPLHWYDVLIELAEAPEQRLRLHELAHSVVLVVVVCPGWWIGWKQQGCLLANPIRQTDEVPSRC